MSEKFLGFIDLRPLIWFHYILLTVIVLLFLALALGLHGENMLSALEIVVLFLAIGLGDQAIHFFLGVD